MVLLCRDLLAVRDGVNLLVYREVTDEALSLVLCVW